MFRFSAPLLKINRFTHWSPKGASMSKDQRAAVLAKHRQREANYLDMEADRFTQRDYRSANRRYVSDLRNSVSAMELDGTGRRPEKMEAMRMMLQLSEAGRAEARKSRPKKGFKW